MLFRSVSQSRYRYDDYAFSIGDSRKEEVLRQIMRMYIPQSINARTLDADAAMAAEMAEGIEHDIPAVVEVDKV